MIDELYLDTKFLKRLKELRRSGKKAALAADRARTIIAGLKTSGRLPVTAATPTRYGELRIKGLRKYDLGSGYRLITFRQGQRFFLLYAGSHDRCDRWLENNRELSVDLIELRCKCHRVRVMEEGGPPAPQPPVPHKENEATLISIDDNDLRRIFCGLTGESA